MSKRFTLAVAIGLALTFAAPALAAGDDGFAAFWKLFSAAAASDDVASLQTMVALGSISDSS